MTQDHDEIVSTHIFGGEKVAAALKLHAHQIEERRGGAEADQSFRVVRADKRWGPKTDGSYSGKRMVQPVPVHEIRPGSIRAPAVIVLLPKRHQLILLWERATAEEARHGRR